MLYTIKTFNKSIISKKINETDERQFVTLPFTVMELGFSDNIVLQKEDFTIAKAKAQVKEKIKAELARLAEYKEYQIEV